jgi:hypothetical protein
MGAWGVLTFDNDNACDWAHRLAGVKNLSYVVEAFAKVRELWDEDEEWAKAVQDLRRPVRG